MTAMDLTVGPNAFFWTAEQQTELYAALETAPVDRVVLGEWVCSKRLSFYQDQIPHWISGLMEAGKQISLTSLALITLKRERKAIAELLDMGVEVEVNDLTALAHIPDKTPFSVGPLINVYNEGTLIWLAERGAQRICLPPELPLDSVRTLCKVAKDHGVIIEMWGHGRIPLAISGRCYHARLHGRTKDNCQFACEADPDGLDVQTLEGTPFLTMNGVQTLSDTYACAAHQLPLLREAGVGALRLSPQSVGFVDLCQSYRQLIDGKLTPDALTRRLLGIVPAQRLSDGFLTGQRGVDWSGSTSHI
jgi:collagenase-like PrtC family protease